MKYQKIENFDIFLYNCDTIGNYNIIQIYKQLLIFLAKEETILDRYIYEDLNEMEIRQKFNQLEKQYQDHFREPIL